MSYVLSHPASEVLRKYLLNQGEVDLPGVGSWPCLLTYLMDGVDVNNLIAIFDDAPSLDGRDMNSGGVMFHYGVVIRLRSSVYETGYLKMFDMFSLLASVVRETVSLDAITYLIHTISNRSGVVSLGLERGTKRRRVFEMNLLVSVTRF
jgi:hypothetical protein